MTWTNLGLKSELEDLARRKTRGLTAIERWWHKGVEGTDRNIESFCPLDDSSG